MLRAFFVMIFCLGGLFGHAQTALLAESNGAGAPIAEVKLIQASGDEWQTQAPPSGTVSLQRVTTVTQLAVTRADDTVFIANALPPEAFDGPLAIILQTTPALAPKSIGLQSIRLAGAYTLSGTVYGGSTPLSGATVQLKNTGGTVLDSTVTNGAGFYSFSVDNGTYNLLIIPPGGSEFENSQVNGVAVFNGNLTQNVVLLPESITYQGFVVNLQGQPLGTGMRIDIFRQGVSLAVASHWPVADSAFTFSLEPGSYRLYVQTDGRFGGNPLLPDNFSVDWRQHNQLLENTNQNIVLPITMLSGVVRNHLGNPVPEARFSVYATNNYPDNDTQVHVEYYPGQTKTNSSGEFNLPFLAGFWPITIQAPIGSGLGSEYFHKFDVTADRVHDFILEPAKNLHGTIRLRNGLIPSVVTLQAQHSSNTLSQHVFDEIVNLNANGEYSLPLASGAYDINLGNYQDNNPSIIRFMISPILDNLPVTTHTLLDIVVPTVDYSGTIVDSLGNPVPNVEILVNGQGFQGSHSFYYNVYGETTSDASGHYSFTILECAADIQFTPPPGSDLPIVQQVENFTTDSIKNFVIPRNVKMQGTVSGPGNQPLAGITLYIINQGSNSGAILANDITDSAGTYEFNVAPGTYKLSASGGNQDGTNPPFPYSFFLFEMERDIILTTSTTHDIAFPAALLRGRTTDRNSVGVPGVVLQVPTGFWDPVRQTSVHWNQVAPVDFKSDSTGTYQMLVYAMNQALSIQPPPQSGFANIVLNNQPFPQGQIINQNVVLNYIDTIPPVFISGPLASGITRESAIVAWQTNEPTSGTLYYGDGATTNTLSISNVRTAHEVQLSGLGVSTEYIAYIVAVDLSGNGPVTSRRVHFTTSALPDATAPAIIEGPVVLSISKHSATVYWRTDEHANSRVNYGLSSTTLNANVVHAGFALEHEVHLTNLTSGTLYFLNVHSTDLFDNGPTISRTISFYTLPSSELDPPVIVEGPMAIDITRDGATIVWRTNEPATSGVSYNDGTKFGVVSDESLSIEHRVRLTGLSQNTLYYYTVSSKDAAGNGPTLSNQETFRTLAAGSNSAPRIIEGPYAAAISHNTALIGWFTNKSGDSRVEFGTSTTLGRITTIAELNRVHLVALTGLASNTKYYYRAGSADADGNGPLWSSIRNFTTGPTPVNTNPQFIQGPILARRTNRTATYAWKTDRPCDGVIRYRRLGSHWQQVAHSELKLEHVLTMTDLTPNSDYQVVISSTDINGRTVTTGEVFGAGEPSLASVGLAAGPGLEFTTNMAPDTTAPTISPPVAAVGIGNTWVLLRWATNELSDSRVSFGLQNQTLTGFEGDLTPVTEHVVLVTGLTPNTNYTFSAKSRDGSGNESLESSVNAKTNATADTTAPGIAGTPALGSISGGVATLQWTSTEYATSEIFFGPAANQLTTNAIDSGFSAAHQQVLTQLPPGILFYQIISTDPAGNQSTSAIYSTMANQNAAQTWLLYE